MTGSRVALDPVLLVAFTIVWPLAEWLWYYPRSVRAIAAGIPGARARIYRNLLVPEWGFTVCVIGLWVAHRRPWTELRLGWGAPLRLGAGLALAALVLGLLWLQRRAILARPGGLELLQRKLGRADPLMPRTPGERRVFRMVAITAGLCEEILFRGFVMWYFGLWTGTALAVAISSLLFGFGHIYLGVPQVLKSAVSGAVAALIVLAAGSLWPAIIIHAALDLNSGDLGFRALGAVPGKEADSAAPAEA